MQQNGQNGAALAPLPATSKKPKVPDPPHVVALKESLKNHLLAILDKPISIRMLMAVESTARISRELLISLKNPQQIRRGGGNGLLMNGGNYAINPGYADEIGDDDDTLGYDDAAGGIAQFPMPGGMRAETFAATLMRELVAMGDRWRNPPVVDSATDLVMSISRAKADQLGDDIVEGLQAKLRERLALDKAEHTISKPTALSLQETGQSAEALAPDTEEGPRFSSGSTISLELPAAVPPVTIEEHEHEHG